MRMEKERKEVKKRLTEVPITKLNSRDVIKLANAVNSEIQSRLDLLEYLNWSDKVFGDKKVKNGNRKANINR